MARLAVRHRPHHLAAALIAAAAIPPGCALPGAARQSLAAGECGFTVFNRTPHPLEIRMGTRPLSSAPIGALNPGELLNHSAPCPGGVWIAGVPIPSQVGEPTRFGALERWADLVEGARAEIALHWP